MDAKQSQRNQRRKDRAPRHSKIAGQRKTGNVRVLKPHGRPQKRVKINYGRIIMLGIIVCFILWAITPLSNRIKQNDELTKLEKQLSQVKQQNNELRQEVDYLKSPDYVEQKARSLGLSRADEEVIVVVPPDKRDTIRGTKDEVAKKSESKTPQSLWERITGVFSGVR